MFSLPLKYIKLGIAAAVVVAIGFAYFQAKHWYDSAIEEAKMQGRQEVVIEQQQIITRTIVEEQKLNEEEKQELRKQILAQRKQVEELRRKLQVDHELDALLQAKPGLVLKAVQNGTNKVLAEFEEITEWDE